jgi:hypothetical protein
MTMKLYNVTLSLYSASTYKYLPLKTVQVEAGNAEQACAMASEAVGKVPGLSASASKVR